MYKFIPTRENKISYTEIKRQHPTAFHIHKTPDGFLVIFCKRGNQI